MFIPNLDCTVEQVKSLDLYGKPQMNRALPERCATVKLQIESQGTTVRADSSGTRGFADEFVATTAVLLAPSTSVRISDKLNVVGISMKVTSKRPQFSVFGGLDHYEVRGEVWV